jgi:hypothetical protein
MRTSAAQQQVVQEYVEMEMEVVMIIGIHLKKEKIINQSENTTSTQRRGDDDNNKGMM